MRIQLVALATFAALSAGATADAQVRGKPFSANWCKAAQKGSASDASAMWATGACFERGAGGFAQDRNQAVYFYREAARRGFVGAGADLTRLGEAVPDADLAREQTRQQGLMDALGALAGRPQPQPAGPPTAAQMLNRQMRQAGSSPVFSGPPPLPPGVRAGPTAAPRPTPSAPRAHAGVSASSHSSSQSESRRVNEVNGVRTTCTSRDGGPEKCETTPAPKGP